MFLVLLQVPKSFGLVQIFCTRPKIYLHFLAVTNILYQTKRWFAFSKIGFCAGTKVFEEALNAVKFLVWLKKFGPAQNILGLVIGNLDFKSIIIFISHCEAQCSFLESKFWQIIQKQYFITQLLRIFSFTNRGPCLSANKLIKEISSVQCYTAIFIIVLIVSFS